MTELAARLDDGLHVALLWNRSEDSLIVTVNDERTEERFSVDAPRDRALDVFYHPFAYAAAGGHDRYDYRAAIGTPAF